MNTVRMFWHGSEFSLYETLSVRSFLRHGFQVEVFSYTPLNLPDGSVWRDAAEILPASDVFTYRSGAGAGSVSAFSNLFRYKLLYELGGIWADSDLLCLRPFTGLPESFVGLQDARTCNGAILRCPPGSEMCRWLYETARSLGKDIGWGQIGPRLITRAIIERRDKAVVPLPEQVFYPVPWRRAVDLGIPEQTAACETASAGSYCVHWWNEIFRRFAVPKSKLPPRGSFLAKHAETLLGESEAAFWSEAEFLTWLGDDHDAANLTRPASGKGAV